jgi:hypothetical protein
MMTLSPARFGEYSAALFKPALIMPNRYQNSEPGWQNQHVRDWSPKHAGGDHADERNHSNDFAAE